MKVLVCDPISPKGITLLQQRPEFQVTVLPKKLSEAELLPLVSDVVAMVVRSETKVTKKIIEAALQNGVQAVLWRQLVADGGRALADARDPPASLAGRSRRSLGHHRLVGPVEGAEAEVDDAGAGVAGSDPGAAGGGQAVESGEAEEIGHAQAGPSGKRNSAIDSGLRSEL